MKSLFELGVRFIALFYFYSHAIAVYSFIEMFSHSVVDVINYTFIFSGLFILISLLISIVLLFKPNLLSKILKIHDDEKLTSMNIDYTMLLRVGIILIGVSIFVFELLEFVKYSYFSIAELFYENSDINSTIISTLRRITTFFIAMLMMYKSEAIAKLLLQSKEEKMRLCR